MKLVALVTMAAVGTGAWAAEAGGTAPRSVTVCTSGFGAVPDVYVARKMASKIFSSIGVELAWPTPGSCPASPEAIKISFADRAPKAASAGALAYAFPYALPNEGTHIVVLYKRVKETQSGCTPQLLAYVLVHEITHTLQAIVRHSESGIMKAHWDFADYQKMRRASLVFAAEDVELIHLGLDARAARLAGTGLMQVAPR
jgi:hypothetical protein